MLNRNKTHLHYSPEITIAEWIFYTTGIMNHKQNLLGAGMVYICNATLSPQI